MWIGGVQGGVRGGGARGGEMGGGPQTAGAQFYWEGLSVGRGPA